jgi:hypothetical protein
MEESVTLDVPSNGSLLNTSLAFGQLQMLSARVITTAGGMSTREGVSLYALST